MILSTTHMTAWSYVHLKEGMGQVSNTNMLMASPSNLCILVPQFIFYGSGFTWSPSVVDSPFLSLTFLVELITAKGPTT